MTTPSEPVYSAFAKIYDRVMRDVDYTGWALHIRKLCNRFNLPHQRVLELACGSGSIALKLAPKGISMVGVDISQTMLDLAKEKLNGKKIDIPLHRASMADFASLGLRRDFDMVICLYDSLNYLLLEEEVRRCFAQTYDHIRPGGGFIFDITTEYNLMHNFAGYTYAENFSDASYIWDNEYDIVHKLCRSKVTVFLYEDGPYHKHIEEHVQRVYPTDTLMQWVTETGFEILGLFHNLTEQPPKEKCERIHFVCKKPDRA